MALQYGLNNAVDFDSKKLVSFASVLTRTAGQPMDKSQLWYPLDGKTGLQRAQEYAASTSAYVGQEIAVIDVTYEEDGTTIKGTSVTFYGIQDAAGTLKELGSKPLGDDASIAVDENGKIHLYGFATAGEGTLPQVKNGKLEWVTVSAIVQGDGNNSINKTSKTITVNDTIVKDGEGNDTNSVTYDLEVKISAAEDNALTVEDDGLYVANVKHPEYTVAKVEPAEGEFATTYKLQKDNVDVAESIVVTDYTVTVTTENITDDSVAKHYIFKQLGKEIAHIDIPKDLVVDSGSVKTVTEAGQPYEGAEIGDKYIELKIANQETPLYIPAKDLVDVYTVEDTNTIDLNLADEHLLTANVKISAAEGNSLVAKDDGLYVNAPTLPTVEDAEVEGEVVVAVSQSNGAIAVERKALTDLINIPSISIGDATEGAAAETATIAVLAGLEVDETDKHKINPITKEVASKKGLEDLAAIVGNKEEGTGIYADLALINVAIGKKVDSSVATAENGIRFINQKEIDKLAIIEEDGTLTSDKISDLSDTVVALVTGTEEGQLAIEAGAQVNAIETIATPEGILAIGEGKQVTIPYATLTEGVRNVGLVKGSTGVNKVDFVEGVGEVNSLSTDKLVNGSLELVLHGGNASGSGAANY